MYTKKTFGELEVGDELYSLNHISAPWGHVTKHKITNIKKGPYFMVIEIGNYYSNGKSEFIRERLNGTSDYLAPTLEGVKQYWNREYKDKIESQEKEIERLKEGLVSLHSSLNKINEATE